MVASGGGGVVHGLILRPLACPPHQVPYSPPLFLWSLNGPRGGSHKALQSFFFLCFQARIYLQIVLLACLEGVVVFAWLILLWSLAKLAVFRV